MQYSPVLGHSVDLKQSAHIHQDDAPLIVELFEAFVRGRRGLQ